MQTANDNQKSGSEDGAWCFLAEFSLGEIRADPDFEDEAADGLLFQTIQDLGVPPESLKKIKGTLNEFVKQAMAHFNAGKLKTPVYIRLFCQKKAKMDGGWGYFLIERGPGCPVGFAASTHHMVDLYLYKEVRIIGNFPGETSFGFSLQCISDRLVCGHHFTQCPLF